MGMKTRTTKFYCTKVLVVVVLLACINVVSSSLVSKRAARNSQTLETLSVDFPDITKRFLRSDTSTTTGGPTNVIQERALAFSLPGLEQATTSIKSGLSKLIQKLKLQWWRLRQKSSNDVFTLLKLDKTGDKLFESPAFSQWMAFVTVRNKNNPDLAMFSTLASHYTDDALAKMFVTAKQGGSTREVATRMETLQIENWITAGKSADGVFTALRLDQTGDKLFESPIFSNWVAFVVKRNCKYP
ncbi:Secreted RxLR effector peptide protein [Phytophthora palmivora]|uniref:Secreted RxLR effector peptide protein n=1 Tax=Phytophthora palmivora TaxID=4796 RepID=A0A2P4XMQ3_9STRA|nr:Secreted RxLR effector peptide protein [Phytophthora palmivora]